MNPQQVKGIAYLLTAVLFALGGGVLVATGATPTWVDVTVNLVSAIAAALGIGPIVKPSK